MAILKPQRLKGGEEEVQKGLSHLMAKQVSVLGQEERLSRMAK
jgi:hypothetical protein